MEKYQIANEDFSTIIEDLLDRHERSRLEALIAVTRFLGNLKDSINHPT